MAYNRMSMAGGGNQQQHHGRGRKKEDENDALMRLVSPIALDLQLLTVLRLTSNANAA